MPELQGKDIGRGIMTTLFLKAKLDHYKTVTLHLTTVGLSLYERIGINRNGGMRQYLFS